MDRVERALRDGEDPGQTTAGGETMLHVAAGGWFVWSDDCPGCFRDTPRDAAAQAPWVRIAGTLASAGAALDARDDDGSTPLAVAVGLGFYEIAEALLDLGAQPDLAAKDGTTPLMLASEKGDLEMVRRLLSCRADPCAVAHDGTSPIYLARSLEIARELEAWGADPCWAVMDPTLLTIPSILCAERSGGGPP
ncbi:MAG: ankyrin repeat domain-containing protein [Acidobacteriota bacterium]